MPRRVNVGAIVGGYAQAFNAPGFAVRQIVRFEPWKHPQHFAEALLVVRIFDLRPQAGRVGVRIVGENDGEVEQAEFRECEGHGEGLLDKLCRRTVVGKAEGLFLCGRQFRKAAKQRFDALVWIERNERPAIGPEKIGKRIDDLGDRQSKRRKLKLAADVDRGCSGQITGSAAYRHPPCGGLLGDRADVGLGRRIGARQFAHEGRAEAGRFSGSRDEAWKAQGYS